MGFFRNLFIKSITASQERKREAFKRVTGVDVRNLTPVLGRDTSLEPVVRQVFRVLDFDKGHTSIDEAGCIHASSQFEPYAFLLVESPILNSRAKLAVLHATDFLLACTVFDEPFMLNVFGEQELLVTYAPKKLLRGGLSGTADHVLHYVIVPRGTLEEYYGYKDDLHMSHPNPELLFGPFVYQGEVRVSLNPTPHFGS